MSNLNKKSLTGLILFFMFPVMGEAYAFQGTFDQTMSLEEKVLAQFRVTTKDDNVRMEILNGQEPELVIENSEGYFRVYPNKKLAIQMPKVDRHTFLDDMDKFDEYLKANQGEKKGEEKLADNDTEIFEYTDPMSKQKGKAWVMKDSRLPLQIEVPTPQGTLKIEFAAFNTTDKVDDSVFSIPEDIRVISHEQIKAKFTAPPSSGQIAAASPAEQSEPATPPSTTPAN